MSNKKTKIKWKMGKIMERSKEAWTSPLVWWVRETEANRKIRELEAKVVQMASENATLRKLGTATRDAASHIGWTSCETGSVIVMADRTVKEWDEYVHSINKVIHDNTTN